MSERSARRSAVREAAVAGRWHRVEMRARAARQRHASHVERAMSASVEVAR